MLGEQPEPRPTTCWPLNASRMPRLRFRRGRKVCPPTPPLGLIGQPPPKPSNPDQCRGMMRTLARTEKRWFVSRLGHADRLVLVPLQGGQFVVQVCGAFGSEGLSAIKSLRELLRLRTTSRDSALMADFTQH